MSAYDVEPVSNSAQARTQLANRYGIDVVVSKRRELWLLASTRIHIDAVQRLGWFLELEVVLDPGESEDAGRLEAESQSRAFGLTTAQYVAGSYADLVRSRLPDW